MTKLILIAALVLITLTAACSNQPNETYQAPPLQPQQLQQNTEQQQRQQNLFTEKGLSKTEQRQQEPALPQEEKPQPLVKQEPQEPAAAAQNLETQDNFYYVKKPHWPHMPVTYFIESDDGCGRYEANRIKRAFLGISNATSNAVLFTQANDSGLPPRRRAPICTPRLIRASVISSCNLDVSMTA